MLGIGYTRYASWEQGANLPLIDSIVEICWVLNITPNELLMSPNASDKLSEDEQRLINAYHANLMYQPAIDCLLKLHPKK